MISDQWLEDLMKHPFISSKIKMLTFLGKPGTGIYLIKERSKLVRSRKSQQKHELSQRLGDQIPLGEEIKEDKDEINKRRKMMDGS